MKQLRPERIAGAQGTHKGIVYGALPHSVKCGHLSRLLQPLGLANQIAHWGVIAGRSRSPAPFRGGELFALEK